MRMLTQVGLVAGLLLLIGLLAWQGVLDILALLLASGWWLLALPFVWLPSLLVATQGWLCVFPEGAAPRYVHALVAMWVGRAVNDLLPVATIGGEIIKARMLFIKGYAGLDAAASVMVDKAVQALSVACWGCIGVLVLLMISRHAELAGYAVIGFLILSISAMIFMRMQHLGILGVLAKSGGRLIKTDSWRGLTLNAHQVDERIRQLYSHHHQIIGCLLLRTASLALQTLEVWLACYLLGHPISLPEAVMLRSLTSTLSDIAFIIPNAYGVQEGAFIIIGSMIGLSAELALALSLSLRIRDLLLDPAGLIYLQHLESRRYLAQKKLASG